MNKKIILILIIVVILSSVLFFFRKQLKSLFPTNLEGIFFQASADPSLNMIKFRDCDGSTYSLDFYYLKRIDENSYIPVQHDNYDFIIDQLLGEGTFTVLKPSIDKEKMVIKGFEKIIFKANSLCVSNE